MNIHNNVIVKKRYLPKKYIRKDMDANEHERLSNITHGTQIKVKEHERLSNITHGTQIKVKEHHF